MEDEMNERREDAASPEPLPYELVTTVIREDSRDRFRLTSTETISEIIGEADKVRSLLSGLLQDESYKDIRVIVAVSGTTYLFSERHISCDKAEKLAYLEDTKSEIASKVREDSRQQTTITPVDTLGAVIPGAETDRVNGLLPLLLDDKRFYDIHLIANSRGSRFLYSDRYMTAIFATVLARAIANDPVATIASTVREDSRTYPRPTPVLTFSAPIFNIRADEVDRYAGEVMKRPEYHDIRSLKASTGVLYLYSDTYIKEDFVRATIEWEEVGKYLNP